MIRRTKTKKTIIKKTNPVGLKLSRKEMRFSVSLVILIGMLTFSLFLLLFSLNKSVAINANTQTSFSVPKTNSNIAQKTTAAKSYIFTEGGAENFQLTIPITWKDWVYNTGEVKSPIDDSLSDGYIKISLPNTIHENAGANSPNLNSRYTDIMTIMNFSADEWKTMEKKCNKGDNNICDAMGKKLADSQRPSIGAGNSDSVYSYTIQPNCGSFEARCNEVDKIMESFKMVK